MTESANGARVVVRLGTEADAAAAALLHSGSISEGFLAGLGPRFLARLYRRIVLSPDAFLLVAEGDGAKGDGAPAGFIAGALDLGALYRRFLLHDGVPAALSALPQLLSSWRHAFETLRHGTRSPTTNPATSGRPGSDSTLGSEMAGARAPEGKAAELLAVAVDPDWRGQHIGTLLVDAFLSELERRRVENAQVVVGIENAVAIALYRRSGFEPDHAFELHRGTTSLLMRRVGGGGPGVP